MGGHALPEGITERKSADEYLVIKAQVVNIFASSDSPVTVYHIRELPGKASFGDLDLLCVLKDELQCELIDFIVLHFAPKAWKRNGEILSFEYLRFQVDLIISDKKKLPMYRFMLEYGDKGMILGQLAHAHGLSLTNRGLEISNLSFCPWDTDEQARIGNLVGRQKRTLLKPILLSDDPEVIAIFFALHGKMDSINSQEDVAQLIKSSNLYRPLIFARQCISNEKEFIRRCSSRPFYRKFLVSVMREILDTKAEDDSLLGDVQRLESLISLQNDCDPQSIVHAFRSFSDLIHDPVDKPNYQRYALDYFCKWSELQSQKDNVMRRLETSNRFNGSMLTIFGFPPKSIGEAKTSFLLWLREQSRLDGIEVDQSDESFLLSISKQSIEAKLKEWSTTVGTRFRT